MQAAVLHTQLQFTCPSVPAAVLHLYTPCLQLFMKRLELCDDPAAKEYLRYTTAQMLEGGFNYQVMFEG
jgi:hypothetical protein